MLVNIEESLSLIKEELDSIERRREDILKGMRDVLLNCRRAIVSIHNNMLDDAKSYIDTADKKHEDLKDKAKEDLYYYLLDCEVELVEAKVLYAIAKGLKIPSYKELGVKGSSYILGILDCIGELKRMVLDLLRNNKYDDANKLFRLMEDLYSLLMPFAVYDNIVQGVRRKLDQDKVTIESIREVITEEVRRQEFISNLSIKLDRS